MRPLDISRLSLYTMLGVVLLSTVFVIMTLQGAYSYYKIRSSTIAEMIQGLDHSIQKLEKNISGFMSSYEVNEYEKLVATEMARKDNLAIIVEDYNTGKIIGRGVYVSGKIRDEGNNIVEYDQNNSEQKRRLENSFYSKTYDVTNSAAKVIGHIRVYKSSIVLNRKLNEIILNSLFSTIIISLLLSVILFFSIRLFLLRPLSNIVAIISDSDEHGIPQQGIPNRGSKEIVSLSRTMNAMIATIKESRVTLTKQRNELKAREDQLLTLSMATEQSPVSIIICDPNNRVEYVNPQFEKTSGFLSNEILDRPVDSLFHQGDDNQGQLSELNNKLKAGETWVGELIPMSKDGKQYFIRLSVSPIILDDNSLTHYIYVAEDITEQKRNEKILRDSAKMDALGKLTGGIAHDYNNLLGIIQGYAELLRDNLLDDKTSLKYAAEIQNAAERGSKLTKRLLAFTKHETSDHTIVDVSKLVKELEDMLEKTLTARFNLVLKLEAELWPAKLDGSELEDAILNICINAVHAMSAGGYLTIETKNIRLAPIDAQQLQLETGDYICLSISDTGCGIDALTREKIFDPFFTTKGEMGTGLGLSQVYGFVERSRGAITVESEPEKGSRFSLYFPRTNEKSHGITAEKTTHTRDLSGKESILVVDDEQNLVEFLAVILSRNGYRVCTANDGKQAIEVLERTSVDLVISDVIMPNMDGYELALYIKQHYPQVAIQLVSGFADERHRVTNDKSLQKNIMYKPYKSNELLERVRTILDNRNQTITLNGRYILIVDDEKDVQQLFKWNLEKLGCNLKLASNGDEAISLYQDFLKNGKYFDAIIMDLSIPGGINGNDIMKKIRSLHPTAKIVVASGHSESPEMTRSQEHGFNASLEKDFDRKKMKQVLERVIFES